MATNSQGTGTSARPSDRSTTVETANTPINTATGVGGVAVYDQDGNPANHPSTRTSSSIVDDRAPVETRSSGSMLTWIISAIVLIAIVYFLLQWVF